MNQFIYLIAIIMGIIYVAAPIVLIIMIPFVVYELIINIVNLWYYYRLKRKTRRRR